MEVLLSVISTVGSECRTIPMVCWRDSEKEKVFLYELKGPRDTNLLSDTIARLEVTVRP